MAKPPLIFTFYIAASIEKVWDGFVSKEANQQIFLGADFEADLRPGGAMTWSEPGKDGTPMRYVTGEVLRVEAPRLLEYKFGMGDGAVMSGVRVELTPESEAVKVVVTNDEWADDNPVYAQNADGWPRILSRLKTLLETGTTFRDVLTRPTRTDSHHSTCATRARTPKPTRRRTRPPRRPTPPRRQSTAPEPVAPANTPRIPPARA
jgi:uncharacterized protein YndB with AHSA1/START domain